MSAERTENAAFGAAPRAGSNDSAERLTVVEADERAVPGWTAFVAEAPGAELYHDYRWRSVIENVFGHECRYLVARAGADVRGVLPLVRLNSKLFGNFLVSVPYFNYGGVLADSPGAETALLDAAVALGRELGVSHIELRQRSDSALDWPAREDKITMRLDLPATEEDLWKSFPSKLRSQIRRPEKAGATCRSGGAELLDDFYAVFARNMRDLGTPVSPRRFHAAILEAFPEQARLFVVYLEGRPVAGGVVAGHRTVLEIPWASSLREANNVGVNMLLYWSVLKDAVARGFRQFDFGRSSKDSGTYRFKEQWGAKPQQLKWHYWLARGGPLPMLNPANPKYRLAISLWQRLPLPVANLLGPRIVKYLP